MVAFVVVNVNVEIVVRSAAVSFTRLTSPPPETDTLFVTEFAALTATFIVTVIGG